jgi:hypothetical protein
VKRVAAIICALGLTGCAEIKSVSIVGHGLSKHAEPRNSPRKWNETNVGGGIRVDMSRNIGIQVGGYRNSKDNNTSYITADWSPLKTNIGRCNLGLGTFIGAVTGYAYKKSPVSAIGGLQTSVKCGKMGIRGRVIPAPTAKVVGTVEAFYTIWEW